VLHRQIGGPRDAPNGCLVWGHVGQAFADGARPASTVTPATLLGGRTQRGTR
jgi:hypothetical protein